jgi:hypothetical protein
VKDSGVGMTPDQLKALFQEGVQFDAGKLQAGQGSGLGLWISKGVVEKHGGYLSATSQGRDTGSEFILELPVFQVEEARSTPLATATSPRMRLQNLFSNNSQSSGSIKDDTTSDVELTTLPPISKIQTPKTYQIGGTLDKNHFNGKRILVVDDTASTRKVMCRLLTNCGCETFQARDGQECVDMVSSNLHAPFDLILMDFEMPILNGPNATKKLVELRL